MTNDHRQQGQEQVAQEVEEYMHNLEIRKTTLKARKCGERIWRIKNQRTAERMSSNKRDSFLQQYREYVPRRTSTTVSAQGHLKENL